MLSSISLFRPAIINNKQAKFEHKNYYPNLAPLKQDTVSFSGGISKSVDLMDLPADRIIKVCKKAIKEHFVIGEGQEAVAIKIQDYPYYCIRQEKKTTSKSKQLGLDMKLDKYDKVNHVVAHLAPGIQLMRYIPGIPLKIMRHSDTASGIKVKQALQELVANNFPEEDLVGRVYEYFLRAYAASGTKEDGEFYTPASVVRLIAELIEPFNGTVYDPCCGSGGMFVQSMKLIDSHHGNRDNVSIIGQEKQPETWRLCKMNLAVRGIAYNLGETCASTFLNDQHKDKDGRINFIMANPPFNLKGWRGEDELIHDKRFSGYEVMPPVANANYAWILHMLSKLNPSNGVAGFLLANGALNADGDEYKIRKKIIQDDRIEAIIVLPRDMFYTTDISVTLWILNMNKKGGFFNGRNLRNRENEILFMDLRTWDENTDEIALEKGKKKKTAFNDNQIAKIKNMYESWRSADSTDYRDIPELCRSVRLPEIEENDFSLAPSRYIEFIDHDLEIDYEKEMNRIQREIKDVLIEEKQSQKLLEEAFEGIGYGIN